MEGEPSRPARGADRDRDRGRPLGRRRPGAGWCAASPRHDELADALRGRPLAGHDVKSLGGGRHGLLAAAEREGVDVLIGHDTMLAAYLLDPARRSYELVELAADAGLGVAREEPARAARGGGRGGAARARRGGGGVLDPAEEARLVGELAEQQRPGSRSSGCESCSTRWSSRWSTCSPRWSEWG